jgi:hypothetical protein
MLFVILFVMHVKGELQVRKVKFMTVLSNGVEGH